MRTKVLLFVLLVVIVGVVGYIWLQPRPSADWGAGLSSQVCPHDRTAVVTVVQLQTGSNGEYNGASLNAYNQYGELLVSGNVEVVWRRAWRNPVTSQRGYTGYYLTTDRDLYYGIYGSEAVKTLAADSTDPEMIGLDNQGRTVYYKGLNGTSVGGKQIVPIASLTGQPDDRRLTALGLVAAGDSTRVVTCQGANGAVETVTYGNTLDALEDVGGGGRVLFTDAVLTGDMVPVDSESHQFRLVKGDEYIGPDRIIQPLKDPFRGYVEVAPGVELLTFNQEKTGRYWWLAMVARPSGAFDMHINGDINYADDWASVSFVHTERANSVEKVASFKGIDPVAMQALHGAGVSNESISQGLGNADASAGTHGPEPDSPYTASVDIDIRGLSEDEIRDTLHRLRLAGFAAFYRPTVGDFPHIHAVYAGVCRLKDSTDAQTKSFLNGHNGLKGDAVETVMPPTEEEKIAVAKVYASPYCRANGVSPDTTVAQVGSGNTLHPMRFMDAMYTSYFGSYNPDGYYGSLPVGHWDVSYDRGRIIPDAAFLNGAKGKAIVPISDSAPAPVPEGCDECMATSGTNGLVATYGVYMMDSPWQDAYSRGYSPNSWNGSKIAEFTYNFDKPDDPIEFDYNFSSLTEAQRRLGYKWGISLAFIGNNQPTSDFNEVVYLQQVFTNTVSLLGEPIGMWMDYQFGDSGINRVISEGMMGSDVYPTSSTSDTISWNDAQLANLPEDEPSVSAADNSDQLGKPDVTDQSTTVISSDAGSTANKTPVTVNEPAEPVVPSDPVIPSNPTDYYNPEVAVEEGFNWFTSEPTVELVANPTDLPVITELPDYAPQPEYSPIQSFFDDFLNQPPEPTVYHDPYIAAANEGNENTPVVEEFLYTPPAEPLFNEWTDYLTPSDYLDTAYNTLESVVEAVVDVVYYPDLEEMGTAQATNTETVNPVVVSDPASLYNPEVAVEDDFVWFTAEPTVEPATEPASLAVITELPSYAPEPEYSPVQSFVDDLLNQPPEPTVYHDPYIAAANVENESAPVEDEFIYTPPAEPLFNEWTDYLTPSDYLDTAYNTLESLVETVVDVVYYPDLEVMLVAEPTALGEPAPAPVLPTISAPTVPEKIVSAVTSIPDVIASYVAPEPQEPVVLDIVDQASIKLAEAKDRISTLAAKKLEQTRIVTQAKKTKDRVAVKSAQKELTVTKRAHTVAQREYSLKSRSYVAFVRARDQLATLRVNAGDTPSRAMKRKLVVAERTYTRAETSLKKVFSL